MLRITDKQSSQVLFFFAASLFVTTDAISGTGGAMFSDIYTFFEDLILGFFGKSISLAAVAVGSIFAIGRANPILVLVGVAFAIFLNYTPGMISGVMTATV